MQSESMQIVECPRDAMQGVKEYIAVDDKVRYINSLLEVRFDLLDFGSFVSPKSIPQMKDTAVVLNRLNLPSGHTPLLAIVANERGANDASAFDEITYLGYPFSVSPTFQMRNTNATMEQSLKRTEAIIEIAGRHRKKPLIYLSMAFGNPYGDPYDPQVVIEWAKRIADLGVTEMALADTIGVADPTGIESLFSALIPALPQVHFGAHLHTTPSQWEEKVLAAWNSGCRRFDGAIKGYGGCPMAADELTGNMPTESILEFCRSRNISNRVNQASFQSAMLIAEEIFHR